MAFAYCAALRGAVDVDFAHFKIPFVFVDFIDHLAGVSIFAFHVVAAEVDALAVEVAEAADAQDLVGGCAGQA